MGSTWPLEGKWGATWKKKWLLRSRRLRLTTVGDPPRWPRDTPLSTKVGTKYRRQVAVAQSLFARGLYIYIYSPLFCWSVLTDALSLFLMFFKFWNAVLRLISWFQTERHAYGTCLCGCLLINVASNADRFLRNLVRTRRPLQCVRAFHQ
jgi:hypothetical protein